MDGLRERKKAATRQAISDTATRLFVRHGFEAVTVAQIAAAADVSVKTVFNYFGSKEELFFDREDEIRELLVTRLRDRPPGVTATAVMRPLLLGGPVPFAQDCRWSDLEGPLYDRLRDFLACERASSALTSRRLVIGQAWAQAMAQPTGSPAWAAMAVAVLGLRHRTLSDALLERRAPRTVERRVRTVVGDALDRLERAFPDV